MSERLSFKNVIATCEGDAEHPNLWRGLCGAWLPELGRTGLSLHDLTRRNTGTLTNFGSLSTEWLKDGLSYDGTNNFVKFTSVKGMPAIQKQRAISIWFQYDGTSSRRMLFAQSVADDASSSNSVNVEVNVAFTAPIIRVQGWGNSPVLASAYINTIAANTWIHCVVNLASSGATNSEVFINGTKRTQAITVDASVETGNVNFMRIGAFNSSFPDPYANRPIGGIAVYNRYLKASEVQTLYADRFAIARPRLQEIGKAPAAGGFQSAWASRATQVSGVYV